MLTGAFHTCVIEVRAELPHPAKSTSATAAIERPSA
jgi:hypothetical protein